MVEVLEEVTVDIISAIDQATGCQQCGNPLERSVSDDFCGEGCQQAWHASRVRSTSAASAPPWTMGPGVVYRSDGERWIEFGRVDGRVTPLAHFDINLNGDIVDNTEALRERATSNADVRGWIAPEVWDYLRQGEGS